MQLWNWHGIDVINAHERDPRKHTDGMQKAADKVAQGNLDPEFLYTHGFALEEIADASSTLEHRPNGYLKGCVRPAAKGVSKHDDIGKATA